MKKKLHILLKIPFLKKKFMDLLGWGIFAFILSLFTLFYRPGDDRYLISLLLTLPLVPIFIYQIRRYISKINFASTYNTKNKNENLSLTCQYLQENKINYKQLDKDIFEIRNFYRKQDAIEEVFYIIIEDNAIITTTVNSSMYGVKLPFFRKVFSVQPNKYKADFMKWLKENKVAF